MRVVRGGAPSTPSHTTSYSPHQSHLPQPALGGRVKAGRVFVEDRQGFHTLPHLPELPTPFTPSTAGAWRQGRDRKRVRQGTAGLSHPRTPSQTSHTIHTFHSWRLEAGSRPVEGSSRYAREGAPMRAIDTLRRRLMPPLQGE